MSNFEKELKDLIQDVLRNIAYCEFNNMYSSKSYNEEINNHECVLSGLLTLAKNCNINIQGLRGSCCSYIASVEHYKDYNTKKDWW